MPAAGRAVPRRFEGRIAVVTGASRGIGFAVARRLAAEGAHVYALAQTVGGLEELDDAIQAAGGRATLVPIDLTKAEGIDTLGGALAERHGRLDVLVGAAGMLGRLTPVAHMPPEEFAAVFALNVTANARLIRSFDPLLRAAPAGRALFVTDSTELTGAAYWGPYAASKRALEALVLAYAAEVRRTALRVNLIDPGAVATRLREQAFPGENPADLPAPAAVADHFLPLLAADYAEHGTVVRLGG
ncbi:MAG: SDR family NAD(P)-dependent oxidoreductase [Alphaproteobacteria bacterium]|nr:SDR family NAD(P)-dependent oxidoreductase [Alphaproteobacteria bacterium]